MRVPMNFYPTRPRLRAHERTKKIAEPLKTRTYPAEDKSYRRHCTDNEEGSFHSTERARSKGYVIERKEHFLSIIAQGIFLMMRGPLL